jgi:hypothetical protein
MSAPSGDQLVHARYQVVAAHVGDLRMQPELLRDLGHRRRAAVGVQAARIRDDLDAPMTCSICVTNVRA